MTHLQVVVTNTLHIPLLLSSVALLAECYRHLEPLSLRFISGYSNIVVITALSTLGHIAVFWVGGLILSIPLLLRLRGKVQPKSIGCVCSGISLVLFNSFLSLLLSVITFTYLLPCSLSRLPPTLSIIGNFMIFIPIEETLFFWIHFMFHRSKFLYKKIHKIHHTYTAPTAYQAVYAHPVEHILINIFPLLLGPVLMRAHVFEGVLWLGLAQLTTLVAHCGYVIPLIPTNPLHDLHHLHFRYNYGVLGVWDYLMGTLRTSEPDDIISGVDESVKDQSKND